MIKVTLTPIKNLIHYKIHGKIYCTQANRLIKNSGCLDKEDLIWKKIFNNNETLQMFLNDNKRIVIESELYKFGYDSCDFIRN